MIHTKFTHSSKKNYTCQSTPIDNHSVPQGPQTDPIIQGQLGMKLAAGQVVRTYTGRLTTPFPAFKTKITAKLLKAVDAWLMANALAEVTARGDRFNAVWIAQALDIPSQADKDSAELLLFAFNPIMTHPFQPFNPKPGEIK